MEAMWNIVVSPELSRPQIHISHEDALFSLLKSSRGHRFDFSLGEGAKVSGAILGVQEVEGAGGVKVRNVVVMGNETQVVMVPLSEVRAIVAEDPEVQANLKEAVVAVIAERQSGIPLTLILPQGCNDTVSFSYATVTKSPWMSSYRIALHSGEGRSKGVEITALAEVLNDSQLDWRNLRITFITGAPELLGSEDGSDGGDGPGRNLPKKEGGFALSLKMPSGSITRMMVMGSDTVESLAAKLRANHGVSGAKFILNGKQMEGGRVLSDYGVGAQTTLTVLSTADVGNAGPPSAQVSFLLSDEASLTYHRAPAPITCGRSASLVVPYLTSAVIPAEVVHLYDPTKRSGNPALSLLFVNTFSRLEGGKVLVQDANHGKMLGEAKICAVPLGDDVLMPYAVDLSVEISFESVVSTGAAIEIRCDKGKGAIVTKRPQLNTTTYSVENRSASEINLLVKHRFLEGWVLVKEASTLEPVDIADGLYTLSTLVPPSCKGSKPFLITVVEKTFVDESRDVQGLSDEDIDRLAANKFITSAVESQLKEIAKLRKYEESLGRKIHLAQTEAGEIRQSQDRTKDTLQVLGDTPDAKRFLKQLSNEQDKIDDLMATVKSHQVNKNKTLSEIALAVEKLAFKVTL